MLDPVGNVAANLPPEDASLLPGQVQVERCLARRRCRSGIGEINGGVAEPASSVPRRRDDALNDNKSESKLNDD
jgi:hypothetical protein